MKPKNKRIKRTRAKISGTAKRPRLAVFRSLKHLYVQLIDDEKGQTLAAASSFEVKGKSAAEEVGKLIAKKALAKKIKVAVFDRRAYKYHGQIKMVADGARKEGLKI